MPPTCAPAVLSRASNLPSALIDGIETRYEVRGEGAPLLMFSPGGFDGTLDKWSTQGIYPRIRLLDELARRYRCIIFDRRETGHSGGRVEVLTWRRYAAQGKGLLEHLGIERAHLLGGCMGCPPVLAFAVQYPEAVQSMVLYWPVGGAKYRISNHQRFAVHIEYVQAHGLAAVAELARATGKSFGEDARGGPWASVLQRDAAFAQAYAALEPLEYRRIVLQTCRTLYDRDTSPGAEPEELLQLAAPALVVPGRDPSHATSAARYLEECLKGAEYWDVPPEGQTAATAPARVLEFLRAQ